MHLLSKIDEQYRPEQKMLIEQERKRIAREIHDGAAQRITNAMYKLEYIQRIFEHQPELAQHELAHLHTILAESLQDLRHSIASLIPPQVERQDIHATTTPVAVLTTREREVLSLIAEGSTNRVIAKKLSISVETVKSHVRHIIQKMHVEDRTQAAVHATRHQWL